MEGGLTKNNNLGFGTISSSLDSSIKCNFEGKERIAVLPGLGLTVLITVSISVAQTNFGCAF
jgi:hypothetical protein